jgi:sugar/nucleoside kinase (ribokinase family)
LKGDLKMKEIRQRTAEMLRERKDLLEVKKATIGIDAFIDKIVRVVHSKDEEKGYTFFNDIAQFGKHVVSKSGMSCGIEICERFTKLGGNAPIMANALGFLGAKVACVGALGYPEVDPIFKDLSPNCSLYSFGNPGYTTALEFNDGKIMLSQRDYLHNIHWQTLKDVIGLDKLTEFFTTSNLVGLVNWNGMINFNEIFRGILDEILKNTAPNKETVTFFDMADFSERSQEDIREAVKLINEFNTYNSVVFGLNENEAILLFKALFPEKEVPELKELGQYMYDNLSVDYLVVHTLTDSLAWSKNEFAEVPSLYVKKPKLSTGGGDNFNAGLCFGFLLGLDLSGALYAANGTSGYYVRNAQSPTIEDLAATLENWDDLLETP